MVERQRQRSLPDPAPYGGLRQQIGDLALNSWWGIEAGYDCLRTEASTDGQATWTALDGTAHGEPIDRDSAGKARAGRVRQHRPVPRPRSARTARTASPRAGPMRRPGSRASFNGLTMTVRVGPAVRNPTQ